MSQENNQQEWNNQQEQTETYQDPIAASTGGEPAKKKVSGSTIAATVVSVIVFYLFGIIGGLICYGGYWAVRAIAKSKMPLAARIILGILVGLIFFVLLIVFILFSAAVAGA